MKPHFFNFDLLRLEPASGYDLDVTGITSELHNLFQAFRSNIDRVYNVIRIPSSIIENIGSYFAKWETIKHHLDYRSKKEVIDVNVELKRIFTDSNLHLFDALDKETYSYFQQAIQDVKALQDTGEDYALKMPVEVMHAKLNQLVREGSATNGFFDGIVRPVLEKLKSNLLKNSRIQDWLRNQLDSGITSAWTAFEVLAGDAWRVMINTFPREYAKSIATANKNKTLTYEVLMDQYDFDIANRMGEVFESIYDMSKYRELKKAYTDAFGDQDLDTIIANDHLYCNVSPEVAQVVS